MRVLFTHSYFLRLDPKQWRQMKPYAPLGTLLAAALLRHHGMDVSLHDTMFCYGPQSLKAPLAAVRPDVLVVYDDGFNYLTKMCLTNMRHAAFEMCLMAKRAGCRVVVCSSDAADQAALYLASGADFVIMGEGERTLLELTQALERGDDNFSGINGLVFRTDDGLVRTQPRKVMHLLDELPLPAWDLADMAAYRRAWVESTGYFSINVSTTRGCPFKCNWCAKPIYGNRYNVRSPEHVVRELQMLKAHYGFEHVWFCDDIFGLKPGWAGEFARLVAERGLKFRFKIQSRADLLLDDGQVASLAAAGCETVWIGAESGSQKILDAMDKGITTEQIARVSEQLRTRGIRVAFFLQFGYPGETREDIAKTLKMVGDLQPDDIGISISYPLPGTKFYERVKEELSVKSNWRDSDDLDMMFRSAFDTAFYRRLHQYVHAGYRRRQAARSSNRTLKGILRKPYYYTREKWFGFLLGGMSW